VAAALCLASGCSAATTTFLEPGGGDPGVEPGDGDERASSGAGGGATGDGGAADVDVPPTVPTKVGKIWVGQTITIVSGQQYYSSYATAMFYETPPPSGGSSCTYAKHGTCHVYDCPLGGPTPEAGSLRYAAGGSVSITGGFTTYTLSTQAGSYETQSSQQLLFDAGTVLRASSTGGEVPAFSNKTLTVPSVSFAVQSPALGWSGANGRDVQVNVSTIQQNVRSVSIACTFTGTQSTATIPAAAMSKLLPTSAATKGFVSVGAPVENTFSAGAWVVTFALNGSPASSSFTTTN
jgi:hypothetical protein